MRTPLMTWLLAGALLASLSWNAAQLRRVPAPSAADGACCIETDGLGLDDAQHERLEALCSRSCGASDRLERRADALQAQLLAGLSGPEVDRAAVLLLVEEVGRLRQDSLAACVEGILELREVLRPGDVRALLERCEPGACAAR